MSAAYKDFKKVKEDHKTTTMQHPMGHVIVIAHEKLSPKMREELKKLPLHKAKGGSVQHFNDGTPDGTVSTPSEADMAAENYTNQPYLINNLPNTTTTAQAASSTTPAAATAQTPASDENDDDDQTNGAPTAIPPAPPMPAAQASSLPQQPAPIDAIKQQNHMNEYADTEADIAAKQIQPQTLSSMFGKQDTLSKLGTIFGLLIGSGGAGLSKQPNMLMNLMQQQMDRDLDAQKTNVTNARDFLKVNYDHQFQLAQQHQMDVNNTYNEALTDALKQKTPAEIAATKAKTALDIAQAAAVPYQNRLSAAQADNLHQQATEKAMLNSKNQMMAAAYYQRVDEVNAMPEGPAKQSAQNALATMYPQIQAAAKNNITQYNAQKNYTNMMMGGSGGVSPDSGLINYPRMTQLQIMGQNKIPGGMSVEDISHATTEATSVEELEAIRGSWQQSFDELNKLSFAGLLTPGLRSAYVGTLGGKLSLMQDKRFNLQQAQQAVDSMLPRAGDMPGTDVVKKQQGSKFFDVQEAGIPTLKRYHLVNQKQQSSQAPQQNQIQEGSTSTSKGKPIIYRNGQWVPQ